MQIENKYIFISYSRKNKRIVNKVVSQLRDTGFSVWIDTTGIESGEQFKQKIVDAIEGCEVFLYFASKESNSSPWTAKEIGIATSLKKRIIPIRLDNSPFNKEVLFDIVNINYIDLSDIKLRSNNIATLISTLTSLCLIVDKERLNKKQPNKVSVSRKWHKLKTTIRPRKLSIISLQKKYGEFKVLALTDKLRFLKENLFHTFTSKSFWLAIIICILLVRCIIGAYQVHTYVKYACTTERKYISTAKYGDILSHDGRVLVTSEPKYDIYIDCTVIDRMPHYNKMSWKDKYIIAKARKAGYEFNLENAYAFSELRKLGEDYYVNSVEISSYKKKTDDLIETEWQHDAEALSKELSSLLLNKSSQEYFKEFLDARYGRHSSRRFIPICKGVEKVICDTISRMPLLRKGQFAGGLIVLENKQRSYPYGDLAGRTLGYSKERIKVGVDGQLDSIIKGRDGEKQTKYINFAGWKKEKQIREIPKLDGADVRTTLAIPMQQVADKVLREYISRDTTIYGGTVTIMDVKTGAIRAMANIEHRGKMSEPVGEYYNLAVGYKFEPGTILGGVALSFFLQGDKDSTILIQNIDSLHSFRHIMNRIEMIEPDTLDARHDYRYVHSLINSSKMDDLNIMNGMAQSSPYLLAGLACSGNVSLDSYLEKFENVLLLEDLQFDITETGGGKPRMVKPVNTDNYNHFLASLGTGYGVAMTPLQILTFYNIIANRGVKVKPYIIESYDNSECYKYKHTHEESPSILSDATIQLLDTVFRYAVMSGKSGVVGKAKYDICGLAGHALNYLGYSERFDTSASGGYITDNGLAQWNSSFVGYFPASDPKYSIICTIVTYKTDKQYFGNDIPAKIVSDIYNSL